MTGGNVMALSRQAARLIYCHGSVATGTRQHGQTLQLLKLQPNWKLVLRFDVKHMCNKPQQEGQNSMYSSRHPVLISPQWALLCAWSDQELS